MSDKRNYTNPKIETRGRKPNYPEGTKVSIKTNRVPDSLADEFQERVKVILDEFKERIWEAHDKNIEVKALDPDFKPTMELKYNSEGVLIQRWEKSVKGEISEEWRPVPAENTENIKN